VFVKKYGSEAVLTRQSANAASDPMGLPRYLHNTASPIKTLYRLALDYRGAIQGEGSTVCIRGVISYVRLNVELFSNMLTRISLLNCI
jgi:hypothetical protein